MTQTKSKNMDLESNISTSQRNQHRGSEAFILCSFIWTFIAFMLFIIYVIMPVVNFNLYHEIDCNVTRVDYPTTLPETNYEVENSLDENRDWVECDCGRRCISWTPCIRIYQGDVLVRDTVAPISISHSTCSFDNYSCPDGEDIRLINQTLTNAKEIGESYRGYNGTCYETADGQFISLTNTLDVGRIVGFSILLFIILIFFIIACISCTRSCGG